MKRSLKYSIVLFIGTLFVSGGLYQLYQYAHREPLYMRDFDYQRDASFIKKLFEDNMYWLVAADEYDVDYMLIHKKTNNDPRRDEKLTIKTLYNENEPLGFIAYFKQSFYSGGIRFVCVDNTFRSRGYAKYMVQYALRDLKRQGVSSVRLVTRTINYPAQKVYTSLGFVEESRNNEFVYYKLHL